MPRFVQVENISCTTNVGACRVSADVDKIPLWFESGDVHLRPSSEAFAGAILLQAMALKANLCFDQPLSPVWLENAGKLMTVFNKWWGYPPIEIQAERRTTSLAEKGEGTALLFSGGVDSFYTLLRGPFSFNYLVFIEGLDVKLDETARLSSMAASARAIAEEVGAKLIIIKTNLKEHPLGGRKYKNSHGGVLASIGHLLPDVRRFVISSSAQKGVWTLPLGSHWETDPLWGDESLEVIHFGEEFGRYAKLEAIAREPLVQKYLMVCQGKVEDRKKNPSFNCGKCEKCVRTMLMLLMQGWLDCYPKFPEKENLRSNIDKIPFLIDAKLPYYEEMLEEGLAGDLKKSVEALLDRTRKLRYLKVFGRRFEKAFAHLLQTKPFSQKVNGFFKDLLS